MDDYERVIIEALSPLAVPVAQLAYRGPEPVYFVFHAQTIPIHYGDDYPSHEKLLIQLHLFAPVQHNTKAIVRQTKRAIHAAGFTYPRAIHAGPAGDKENDGAGQHIVFEFEGVRASEAQYGL